MKELFWALPLLFIFHDFEEILMVERWIQTMDRDLQKKRFPAKIYNTFILPFENVKTIGLATGVATLYTTILLLTLLAYSFNLNELWLAMFLIFTIHLVMHCLQALIYKGYIPAVMTSIICLPICFVIIYYAFHFLSFSIELVVIEALILAIICSIVLSLLHKKMPKISNDIDEK